MENIKDIELNLLTINDIYGSGNKALKKYGSKAVVTDLAILTGACYGPKIYIPYDSSLKGRTGSYITKTEVNYCSLFESIEVYTIGSSGNKEPCDHDSRCYAIRPVLKSYELFRQISQYRRRGDNETYEVEYGEYPQYAPNKDIQKELEKAYKKSELITTGRSYTFDKTNLCDYNQCFQPITYEEYEYQGKKYIRVKSNCDIKVQLSNGKKYKKLDNVWIEVSPVVWLIDDETKTLVSKKGILSGIRFSNNIIKYDSELCFSKTDLKDYLDEYMIKDLMQTFKNNDYFNAMEKLTKNDNLDDLKKLMDKYDSNENKEKKDKNNENISDMKKIDENITYSKEDILKLVEKVKELEEKIEKLERNDSEKCLK